MDKTANITYKLTTYFILYFSVNNLSVEIKC